MNNTEMIFTCEHATNSIPERWKSLFSAHANLLDSHRGIDFGASELAYTLSKSLSCLCIQAKASRLLIDCNRSIKHPHCFSEITQCIPEDEKHAIIQEFYLPYRHSVEQTILKTIQAEKKVHHFSMHSFTPVMNNIVRKTDIGLLYDPGRIAEKNMAKALKQSIQQLAPELRVRMNYPYLGIANGFTQTLRKLHSEQWYTGIEIEINQAITGHSFEENGKIITAPSTPAFEKIKQVLGAAMKMLA